MAGRSGRFDLVVWVALASPATALDDSVVTPAEFEARFAVDQRALRRYLRQRWQHLHNDRWDLSEAQVNDALTKFGVGAGRSDGVRAVPIGQGSVAPRPSLTVVSSPPRSSGLHHEVRSLACSAGIVLSLGRPVPWLTGRGHLDQAVHAATDASVISVLASVHRSLGGDAQLLGSKRAGMSPVPDLVHEETGCIVEVDEVQHFTTARRRSFELYPPNVALGFDLQEYRALVVRWQPTGDRAFAHKTASDFPVPGGRQSQRAYNDALRDLLAPSFTRYPVIRIPVPDRNLAGVVDRLRASLSLLS